MRLKFKSTLCPTLNWNQKQDTPTVLLTCFVFRRVFYNVSCKLFIMRIKFALMSLNAMSFTSSLELTPVSLH